MCGIAGYAGDRPPPPDVIDAMTRRLAHRGPDGEGMFRDGGAVLAMRRLAIIDVAGGDQPISNEDGTVRVVFNGEVYNHEDLRRDLERRGHRFATRSDTEVIVHLYEEHGDTCVEHLRGMFAFALWDSRKHRLLLARDRVGKKPLYYRVDGGGIWFASELTALACVPGWQRRIDPVALDLYLTLQYVPHPWSILEGALKLPPGHTLVFQNADVTLHRYWELTFRPEDDVKEGEALERFGHLLDESTRLRMLAERPVGALLSGGIDSSLVVASMARQAPGRVRTFCVGFDDTSYDERRYARMVAERFGTDHTEEVLRPDPLRMLESLPRHYDEPFADSSALPSLVVAEIARREVVVVLNGDGGDEAFAGYDRYRANLVAGGLGPAWLRQLVGGVGRVLPEGAHERSLYGRGRRFLVRLDADPAVRYQGWMSHFDVAARAAVTTAEFRSHVAEGRVADGFYRALFDQMRGTPLSLMLAADTESYLPGDLLVKMDRATMAHSLEARSPFLDHLMLEFAAGLPDRLKLARIGYRWRGKYLPRRYAAGVLPGAVIHRPKRGFGVPMAHWLRTTLREATRDVLTDGTARSRGLFRPDAVRRLLEEHDAGVDRTSRIWNLLAFELWCRRHVDQAAAPGSSSCAGILP